MSKGSLKISRENGDYELEIIEDKVRIRRYWEGELTDELSIPRKIDEYDREEIILQLFQPETLKDPTNSPPELDKSWIKADILKVCGITLKQERVGMPPESPPQSLSKESLESSVASIKSPTQEVE